MTEKKSGTVAGHLVGFGLNASVLVLCVMSLVAGGVWSTALAWTMIGLTTFVYAIRELSR